MSSVGPVHAWNLVCGVSINMAARAEGKKWDADSHALLGIAHFFTAVSELQRLELNEDGTFKNPASIESRGQAATERAIDELEESHTNFEAALGYARQYKLGDDKGLGLLKDLQSGVAGLIEDMRYASHLPKLEDVQDIVLKISEYNAHGIELSKQHLTAHLHGHGEGGEKYRIED
jgi:hypothetical protein